MTAQVTMKDLLEAGVHFGHQTSRWNPKMKPYIFGARNGIYIIDLQKTVVMAKGALDYVRATAAQGKKMLFIGTKTQAKDVLKEQAERCGCPYVTERWLGGTLTNFQTIQNCLSKLERIQDKYDTGMADQMPKKERSIMDKEYERLIRNLGGIRNIRDVPGAVFIVDPKEEHIAVEEARTLNIPVIAITDTNCDPDSIDYLIPGNDDALKSIKLFATAAAEAYLEGMKVYEERARATKDKAEIEAKIAADNRAEAPVVEKGAPGASTTDREGRTVGVRMKRPARAPQGENK